MALMIFAFLLVMVTMGSAGPVYSVPVAYVALRSVPENIYNHVQDTRTGEYAFGYAGGPVSREESKTADGVTRGAYSYVDAHGIVQHYRYIADDDGFRVTGTNIPTDAASVTPIALEPQVVAESEAVVTETKSAESQSRKKRSIGYNEIPVALEAVSTPLAIASVPTAESSQSSDQIHAHLRTENPVEKVEAIPPTPVAVPVVSVATKAIQVLPETDPVTVAASVPVATSSQSRYQNHKSLKAEIPVETVAAIVAAPAAIPAFKVAVKTIEVLPSAVPVSPAASVPLATSSQSRFQIHKSSKIETSAPIPVGVVHAVPVAPAVAAVEVAAPKAVAAAAVPIAALITVAASLPIATSSQNRFQVHKSLKTEIPVAVVSVAAETVKAASPVHAIPVISETIHASPTAASISIAAATATANHRLSQAHDSLNLELNGLHQPLGYGVLKIQPALAVQPLHSGSLIEQSPVGVGLGVVPSPVAAYYEPALLAQA